MYMASCSRRWRSRMGIMGYMWAKKKSMQALRVSLGSTRGFGVTPGPVAMPAMPFCSFIVMAWRCVSLSSLMTLAREPLGPFFCGIALKVQASCEDEQLRHGLMPSHFTFRRWQASQARFTAVDMIAAAAAAAAAQSEPGGLGTAWGASGGEPVSQGRHPQPLSDGNPALWDGLGRPGATGAQSWGLQEVYRKRSGVESARRACRVRPRGWRDGAECTRRAEQQCLATMDGRGQTRTLLSSNPARDENRRFAMRACRWRSDGE